MELIPLVQLWLSVGIAGSVIIYKDIYKVAVEVESKENKKFKKKFHIINYLTTATGVLVLLPFVITSYLLHVDNDFAEPYIPMLEKAIEKDLWAKNTT